MIEQRVDDWIEEGIKLFGPNTKRWKSVCPCCGRVTKVQEFIDLGQNENAAFQNCIGRFNGKGKPGLKGTIENNANGCDWAAYGLFGTLDKGRIVIADNGTKINVFDFAKEG